MWSREAFEAARRWPGNITFQAVGLTAIPVVAESPTRRRLVLVNATSIPITLTTTWPPVFGNGFTLLNTMAPLVMCIFDFGGIVQKRWNAIANGAGGILGIIEVDIGS